MRVAICTTVMQGGKSGVAAYLFGLFNGLRKLRETSDEAKALTPVLYGFEHEKHLCQPWSDFCEWKSIPSWAKHPVANILWHQIFLPFALKKWGVDVLHIPSYRRVVARPGVPQVVTVHDCAPFQLKGKYDFLRTLYGTKVVVPMLRNSESIITVSSSTAEDIENFMDIRAPQLGVIHNGIDHGKYRKPENQRGILKEMYGVDAPYFIYLSRLEHPAKNHVRLIEAFEKHVATTGGEEHLVFGGADWHGAEVIHERIQASEYRERIHSLGFVPAGDLVDWYAEAVAMVYPSLFEGFGLPPAEAMACGTPVISSNRGSLPEVVEEAGILVDPEDVHQISEAMTKLAQDYQVRAEYVVKGLANAQRFSWDRAAKWTFDVYQKAYRSSEVTIVAKSHVLKTQEAHS